MYRTFGKPVFDLLATTAGLVLILPILAATALAILIEDGRPIIFTHERTGKDGQPFRIFKFRSMAKESRIIASADSGSLIVTRVGRLIRRLNIDELPQLFNILRLDMSLIGPRPGLPTQIDLHGPRHANGSIQLRPGITGLAQVNSFDGMSAEQKAEWDGRYVKSLSLATDLRILVATVAYLFKRPPTY